MIDWNGLTDSLKTQNGEFRSIGGKFYLNLHGEFEEILKLWQSAGYTSRQVQWFNYYPNIHFDGQITTEFSKMVNKKSIKSWVSKICPGYCAPWHQDIDDDEHLYGDRNKLKRYTCFIDKPDIGKILIVEDKCYHLQNTGDILQWSDYKNWHAGTNLSLKNFYLYHFIGKEE